MFWYYPMGHWVDKKNSWAKIFYHFENRMIFLIRVGENVLTPLQVHLNRCICKGISSGSLSECKNYGVQKTWFMKKIFNLFKYAMGKKRLIPLKANLVKWPSKEMRFAGTYTTKFEHFLDVIILSYFRFIFGHRCQFLGPFRFLQKRNFVWTCWLPAPSY